MPVKLQNRSNFLLFVIGMLMLFILATILFVRNDTNTNLVLSKYISVSAIIPYQIEEYPSIHLISSENKILFSHYGMAEISRIENTIDKFISTKTDKIQTPFNKFLTSHLNDLSETNKLVVLTIDASLGDCPPFQELEKQVNEIDMSNYDDLAIIFMRVGT